ncbi:MAG: hypothetical protein V1784_02775, partial [bacterium]
AIPLGETPDRKDAKHIFGLDLTPLGLEDFRSLFAVPVIPKIVTLADGVGVYSDIPVRETIAGMAGTNLAKGIDQAKKLFAAGNLVNTVVLRGATFGNAFALRSHSGVMIIQGIDIFLEMAKEHGWLVAFHESMHLVDNVYGLSAHPAFAAQFKDFPNERNARRTPGNALPSEEDAAIPHPFMAAISEQNWYGFGWFGHPGDNEREFLVSLCASLLNPDIKARFFALSRENQVNYIASLRILARVIKEKIPNGAGLPVYLKAVNTIAYLETAPGR